jgi:hypothetical protein
VSADHADLTTHSEDFFAERERRMLGAIPGKGNDSYNIVNLNEDPRPMPQPRPCSIRTLDGPPPFVPQQLQRRPSSPNRYIPEGHRTNVGENNVPLSPRPIVTGRGVGLYSPHRQRSELKLA